MIIFTFYPSLFSSLISCIVLRIVRKQSARTARGCCRPSPSSLLLPLHRCSPLYITLSTPLTHSFFLPLISSFLFSLSFSSSPQSPSATTTLDRPSHYCNLDHHPTSWRLPLFPVSSFLFLLFLLLSLLPLPLFFASSIAPARDAAVG